jgi:ACS family hexuronate transporter-like MFS transporter
MARRLPIRWVVVGVFVLSSALNYLDRQVLTQLAPLLKSDFQLSNRDFGFVLSAFSVIYAAAAPLAGFFIDRVGLNRGVSLAVGLWSLSGIATGFANGFTGLLATRTGLGLFQAGGVPAVGKAIRQYLLPGERALGQAAGQLGISAGAVLAPPLATWLALHYGWRWAFWLTGLVGFLWIPLWLRASRLAPVQPEPPLASRERVSELLGSPRLWGFVFANALGMVPYTLWTNWTTIYLVQAHGLKLADTAWLAGFPPFAAPFGGFLGGWLSLRLIRQGWEPLAARRRACLLTAFAILLTAAVPLMPAATLATFAIGASLFFSSAFNVNVYAMPLDAFSGARAAFGISMLTGAYGAMQTVISPLIGDLVDRYGFQPVCLAAAVLPLASFAVLRLTDRPT